ncbi:MAG TPA: hypothetical protein VFT45_23665 [Longimicrobium sp.]|nr:hypothetical protein [Longimicrobium sp.]
MRRIRLLLLLVLVPLAFVSLRETRSVNACAEAGGSYDYASRECDMAASHAYEPFMERHGVLIGATLVALLGAGVAVWLRSRALRERGS